MLRSFAKSALTDPQVMSSLKQFLANSADDSLARLTVDELAPRFRMDRGQLECTLSAAQDTRRRFLAKGVIGA